jgi:hypothetical protein
LFIGYAVSSSRATAEKKVVNKKTLQKILMLKRRKNDLDHVRKLSGFLQQEAQRIFSD